jgi:hypothetical protein
MKVPFLEVCWQLTVLEGSEYVDSLTELGGLE